MSKLPTENIFKMWLSQRHRHISQQQTNDLTAVYSYFRQPGCKNAAQLNHFIDERTGTDQNRRRELVRIFKEFINEIKESRTIKGNCNGYKF